METQDLRKRVNLAPTEIPGVETNGKAVEGHPGGDIKHGGPVEILRFLLMITYFLSCCFSYVSFRCFKTWLTGIESASRSFLGYLCIGTTRISTMLIWH
jgi:hypothetical protein